MTKYLRNLLAVLFLLIGARAEAFTPESGFWWNPAEGGSGYTIEIQDNYLFLIGYLYTPTGAPLWLTAQGALQGNSRFQSSANASDGSWLNSFSGGQCAGCIYRPPTSQLGSGGQVTINFVTERTGTMTYAGRTIPIERYDYFLTRTANDQRSDVMVGEWQVVMDLSALASNANYPYFGEVLQFISVDRSAATHFFDGCRPAESLTTLCQATPPPLHPASGRFQSSDGKHIIVVRDFLGSTAAQTRYLAYIVSVGTEQFDGKMAIYTGDQNINTVLANGPFYPVRGFRSASRTYVQTGSGPASNNKAAAAPTVGLGDAILRSFGGQMPQGMSGAQVLAQDGYDPAKYADAVRELTQRLQER